MRYENFKDVQQQQYMVSMCETIVKIGPNLVWVSLTGRWNFQEVLNEKLQNLPDLN